VLGFVALLDHIEVRFAGYIVRLKELHTFVPAVVLKVVVVVQSLVVGTFPSRTAAVVVQA